MNIFKSKTNTGKPKIIDNNGFSIASSTDGRKENHELFERLVLCFNLLSKVKTERLKTMSKFEPFSEDKTEN